MKKFIGTILLSAAISSCGGGICNWHDDCDAGHFCTIDGRCVKGRTCWETYSDCTSDDMCIDGFCQDVYPCCTGKYDCDAHYDCAAHKNVQCDGVCARVTE